MKLSFFVTCGRGMDYFVVKELNKLPQILNLESTDGKVFFEVAESELPSNKLSLLLKLKSVERLFVTICKRESCNNVTEGLMNDLNAWKDAYGIWSVLQDEKPNSQDFLEHVVQARGEFGDQPPVKKIRSDGSLVDKITFRMSPKCAGKRSRMFSMQNTFKLLSEDIQQYLGWHPDLKKPLLEIYLHLNDNFFVIGLPVSKVPLSKRPYLKSINLRSTICWAMAYSANIKSGDIILDPMCGAGTVVIELLKSWPVGTVIGVDSCREQLQRTVENCDFANVLGNINLMYGTVEALPIRSEFVDAVLCDFPFGLKHGTIETVKTLLPRYIEIWLFTAFQGVQNGWQDCYLDQPGARGLSLQPNM